MVGLNYQPEWDAETLTEAERIKADPGRLENARTAATKMLQKKKEEQTALSKVAKGNVKGKLADTNNLSPDGQPGSMMDIKPGGGSNADKGKGALPGKYNGHVKII